MTRSNTTRVATISPSPALRVLVVTNLCLGGISVVAIPLINLSVRNCALQLQPASVLV